MNRSFLVVRSIEISRHVKCKVWWNHLPKKKTSCSKIGIHSLCIEEGLPVENITVRYRDVGQARSLLGQVER